MNTIEEVETILKTLQNKHAALFRVEQYNAWAHMINTGKHTSYDSPPDLPYFHKFRKSTEESRARTSSIGSVSVRQVATPACLSKSNLRSAGITQLEKWHSLYEKKCINIEEYEKVRQSILKDIINTTIIL